MRIPTFSAALYTAQPRAWDQKTSEKQSRLTDTISNTVNPRVTAWTYKHKPFTADTSKKPSTEYFEYIGWQTYASKQRIKEAISRLINAGLPVVYLPRGKVENSPAMTTLRESNFLLRIPDAKTTNPQSGT